MRKSYIFLLIAAFALGGCGAPEQQGPQPDEALEQATSSVVATPYPETASLYTYMIPATFEDDSIKIKTYILDAPEIKKEDMKSSSSNYGITEEVYITKNQDLEIKDFVDSVQKRLKKRKDVSEIVPAISGDVASITFDVLKDNKIYPSVTYIKIEQVKGYLDIRIVTIDNSKTSETSNDVAYEVLETIGLQRPTG